MMSRGLGHQWTRKEVNYYRDGYGLPSWNIVITPSGVLQFNRKTPTRWFVLNVFPSGKVVRREWTHDRGTPDQSLLFDM